MPSYFRQVFVITFSVLQCQHEKKLWLQNSKLFLSLSLSHTHTHTHTQTHTHKFSMVCQNICWSDPSQKIVEKAKNQDSKPHPLWGTPKQSWDTLEGILQEPIITQRPQSHWNFPWSITGFTTRLTQFSLVCSRLTDGIFIAIFHLQWHTRKWNKNTHFQQWCIISVWILS
jgi:hypothetical protein